MNEQDFQKEINNLQGQIYNLRGQVKTLIGIVRILSAAERADPAQSLIHKYIADVLSHLPEEKSDFERGQQYMCNEFMQP